MTRNPKLPDQPTVEKPAVEATGVAVTTSSVPALRDTPSDAPKVSRNWKRWIWAGTAVLLLTGAALWYFQPWASTAVVVAVETVAPGPLTRVLAVNGRVAPLHPVDVRATVGGEVQEVAFKEGQAVKQGDVLARTDPSTQQAVVRQAVAGLDAGLVALAQADASLARAEALNGTISRTALADAKTAAQTAKQEVARLTAQLDQAQIELTKYTTTAPIAGTLLTRNAEVGQVVDPATVMFTLADLGQLVVRTEVDETYATHIALGQPAVLQLVGEADTREGSVTFVAPKVDETTSGLTVDLTFTQPVTAPVGLTVTANITVDSQDAAISVPRAAVVKTEGNSAVFVVEDGLARRHDVKVADWPATRLLVLGGLTGGEVLISDATGLVDGQAVTVAGN